MVKKEGGFKLVNSSRALLIGLLVVVSFNLVSCGLSSMNDSSFPEIYSCIDSSSTDADGSWLCLKETGYKEEIIFETCLVTGYGNILPEENIQDKIGNEENKEDMRFFVNSISEKSINLDQAIQATNLMKQHFFPTEACTDSLSYNINGFGSGIEPWKQKEIDAFAEALGQGGAAVYDLPLMVGCDVDMDSKFVTQAFVVDEDTEEIKLDIFYCKDGVWYDGDTIDEFDADNDGSPRLDDDEENKWVWDCDDTDPAVGADLSPLSFFETGDGEEALVNICGDEKDNFCVEESGFYSTSENKEGILERYESIDEWRQDFLAWDLEDDSCHNNPVACEENCLWGDNSCDYLGFDVETNRDAETGEIDLGGVDIEGGFCCGAGLVDQNSDGGHLGDVKEWSSVDHLCLNNELVPQSIDTEEDSCPSGSKWCWISSALHPLEIFTIKTLGDPAYDLVSEGSDGWLTCYEDNLGAPEGIGPSHSNAIQVNRLYCEEIAGNYMWTECVQEYGVDGAGAQTNTLVANWDSVNVRYTGDGVFSIPIVGEDGIYSADLTEEGIYDFSYQDLYSIGDTLIQTIDFTGYYYLEFFVKYTDDELLKPANVMLKIEGLPIDIETGEEVIYFEDYVLGYAVNAPLLEKDHFIHVKVPVEDWKDIAKITLWPRFYGSNNIEVKNMYVSGKKGYGFSNGGDPSIDFIVDENPAICSGEDSASGNNWLSDLDDNSANTGIAGEGICMERYGDEAWLGYYDEYREVSSPSASCCGDDENEYYSDASKRDNYGCFNSEEIASGETAMTVEYEVKYSEDKKTVDYPDIDLDIDLEPFVTEINVVWECEDYCEGFYEDFDCHKDKSCSLTPFCESTTNPEQICSVEFSGICTDSDLGKVSEFDSVDLSCIETDSFDVGNYGGIYEGSLEEFIEAINSGKYSADQVVYVSDEEKYYEVKNVFSLGDGSHSVNYEDSPEEIASEEVSLTDLLGISEETTLTLEYFGMQYQDPSGEGLSVVEFGSNEELRNINVYFFTPFNQKDWGREITFNRDEFPETFELQIFAEVNAVMLVDDEEGGSGEGDGGEEFSYPCMKDECVFALPGNAPYTIKNKHPDLYDLYFETEEDGGVEEEILITAGSEDEGQVFETDGVLIVRGISQQVLYEYDESLEQGNFYGCNAASYIDGAAILAENYGYCSVQGDYYCAYSDDNFLISTWSDVGITQVGYEEVEEYTEDTELELKSADYSAITLNHSSSSVPGRNVISNADFSEKSYSDLDFWELINDGDGSLEKDETQFLNDDGEWVVFEVAPSYTLRSGKISIAQNEYYSYSDGTGDSECTVNLYLVDKEGNAGGDSGSSISAVEYFSSGENAYLRIEVNGACSYGQAFLQKVDTESIEGEAIFSEINDYDTEFDVRAGAACCPESACWNGYVCVEDMSVTTYMTEETGEDMTYRCIDGDWTSMDVKLDWNGEDAGYCESNSQCYVTSSLSEGASSEASLTDFYEGSYPTCIDDGEYLLDHYCDGGEWTSRTKFIASQFLEFAESDDYILYCDDFRNVFVNYNEDGYNYYNYLAGQVSAELDSEESLGDVLGGSSSSTVSETTTVCFDALENSDTGRRLVSQDENTCINSVCILKYKQGDEYEVAFGTSMNVDKADSQSFLVPLGVASSDLESYCEEDTDGGNAFLSCSDEVWYAEEIESLLYAKEGIGVEGSIIDTVWDWLSGLFSSEEEETEDFLTDAVNFNKLYLASVDDYLVRAVYEKQGGEETIVAEFNEEFETPICDFVDFVNEDLVYQDQWPAEPKKLVDCELDESGVYKVMTATNSQYWWPQLTSGLRIGEEK